MQHFFMFWGKQLLLINTRTLLAVILSYLQEHKQHAVLNKEMPQCSKKKIPPHLEKTLQYLILTFYKEIFKTTEEQ